VSAVVFWEAAVVAMIWNCTLRLREQMINRGTPLSGDFYFVLLRENFIREESEKKST
jgi:hypothetical protein